MKQYQKIFLSISSVLFLLSCSDLSVDKYEAITGELPADFNWQEYAKINADVGVNQIVIKIQNESSAETAERRANNCADLLENSALAKEIYVNYAGCPIYGWDTDANGKCTGIYANNETYNKRSISSVGDTTWTCQIGGCYSGGWEPNTEDLNACINSLSPEEQETYIETGFIPQIPECSGLNDVLKELLPGRITAYRTNYRISNVSNREMRMLCKFTPIVSSAEEAKDYLENFQLDSMLIKQHYFLVGRSEGRPYKECVAGEYDNTKERSRDLEKILVFQSGPGAHYYDYGQYIFCLNNDDKIYVAKEVK